MTLTVRTDRSLIRATHTSSRFLRVEVTAPPAPADHTRPSASLAFVIDRSGSMHGAKIELAKQAVREAIARLASADRFAVVSYDDQIDVLVESTAATPDARRAALAAIGRLDARGSTNLGEGWLRGCGQVADHLAADGVNRVLLLTDGLANVGMTGTDELAGHAAELRRRGVATTTFGVGNDFDEPLLRAMADAGGGHFRFIADERQIVDHISGEVGELLEVTARDVVVGVTGPEGIRVETLSPYPLDTRGERTTIRLGDLVADQAVEIVLRLRFPYGQVGREIGALVSVRSADGALEAGETLRWTYADDRANDVQPRDREVDRVVARAFADRARTEAIRLNRDGQFGEARSALLGVAERVQAYAGHDDDLRAIVAGLRADAEEWSMRQDERSRKVASSMSYNSLKSRAPDGQALRRR
jgi:Ca-activated chloride channel family protein